MNKGIWGPGLLIVLLIFILILVSFWVSTSFGEETTILRYLFEAAIISESDKVETYVRSFQRATELSSIQTIYDSGNENLVLPYEIVTDGYPRYSNKYKMAYWQIYDVLENKMPPPEIMLNKTKQEISWISSCYLYNYQKAFMDFSGASESGILIPDPDFSPTFTNVTFFDDQTITIAGEETVFQKTTNVEGRKIEVVRYFNPYINLNVKFGRIIRKAWDIVDNDILGECVRGVTCSYTTEEGLRNELNGLSNNFKESDIDVVFDLKDPNYGIINVSIYDTSRNYVIYSLANDTIGNRLLGVNFLVKVGDNIDRSDEFPVDSISGFDDCSAYSGLGIISPKGTDDICKFFKFEPNTIEVCQDTDGLGYGRAGTCTDFVGSYEDMCFDLDNDGTDETVYEYGCHSSDVCYFIQHRCGTDECVNNACVVECTQKSECSDANVCTQDICNVGGSVDENYCSNPNEASGVWCGTKYCSSSNCQCVGKDWVCESDTDCDRTCDGAGNCGDCSCQTVDRGCCANSDCPTATPYCDMSTHTCTAIPLCWYDSDCPPDTGCEDYYCDFPGDCCDSTGDVCTGCSYPNCAEPGCELGPCSVENCPQGQCRYIDTCDCTHAGGTCYPNAAICMAGYNQRTCPGGYVECTGCCCFRGCEELGGFCANRAICNSVPETHCLDTYGCPGGSCCCAEYGTTTTTTSTTTTTTICSNPTTCDGEKCCGGYYCCNEYCIPHGIPCPD